MAPHPLDPLSVAELQAAAAACRARNDLDAEPLRFNVITLQARLLHPSRRSACPVARSWTAMHDRERSNAFASKSGCTPHQLQQTHV